MIQSRTPENSRAMGRFLASVERKAFRMARMATRDTEEALDIVQDAMLGLVQRYSKKPQDAWRPLFYRILQSRIRDWHRRNKIRNRFLAWLHTRRPDETGDPEDPIENLPDNPGNSPFEKLIAEDYSTAIESALQGLPLRQQQAFLLRAWEGLNVSETALAMGCSQGSVKTHYSQAVQALRGKLEAYWE